VSRQQNELIHITGGNGFLGSEVARQAVAAAMSVRVSDRQIDSSFGEVDYSRANILNFSDVDGLFRDASHVIHVAGLAHIFSKSQAANAPFKEVNGTGTRNVCEAAAQAGVKHLTLISSVSVYGHHKQGVVYDELVPCNPESLYATSKYQAEKSAIEIAQRSGMNLTILRLATLYGENDPGNVARLMRSIDKRRFLWIGNGSNMKSLLYRGDAARACIAVVRKPQAGIHIYNVSDQPCKMRDVIKGLAMALGRKAPFLQIPAPLALRTGLILSKLAGARGRDLFSTIEKWLEDDGYDGTLFQKTFGFQTEVELNEGLRREVEWYRNLV
jgi:nucleoside-diphosphate-sugar epimerase